MSNGVIGDSTVTGKAIDMEALIIGQAGQTKEAFT
jgi:hypothetical protein